EILEKLGGGGMALVYKAKDSLLNRVVTIKVLRDEFADDEEFVRRFRHEAQAVASLSHPNIVNIFDVGYNEGNHYLVMEFVEGQNLKEIIKLRGALKVEEAIDIAKQICDGLEHAHDNKIIHRDIKPHNILITKNGKIKVADFGLARAVTTSTVTHTKSVLGSVHYFSPEQAKGEVTDEKSDIYSLGVVLYEMLTGQVPFGGGDSPISVALKHIESEPESLRKINPSIPPAVEAVVKRAMAKDIKRRYNKISELKQDLILALSRGYVEEVEDNEFEKTREMEPVKMNNGNNVTQKKKKNDRKLKPVAIIIGVLLLLGIIIAGVFAFTSFWFVGEVAVPDVEGMPLFEANQKLKEVGLNMTIGIRKNDPEIPVDRIISQTPRAGAIVKQNREIVVDVSDGPVLISVPDVQGFSRLEAEIALQNIGFQFEVDLEYSNLIPEGSVIRQLPRAHSEEPEGSVVLLTVSRGVEPRYINMPELVGLTLDEVRNVLLENRLELGLVSYESSRQYFEGVVIKQDVQPQSLVLQGESVNLVISSGPGPASRTANVRVPIPQDRENAEVRIVVIDSLGEKVVYEETHRGGETITRRVEFFGDSSIQVYIDGQLIKEEQFP
ncbi:MAG: Stk1 family PASTA domain-containing Ser/Thr kinase, partial [Bacillota bacterium]|nr:Stk1 family PASTA domain-containing Ser/Thr kinase [Bacillota bacterium]